MSTIRLGIVGVGCCASSLVQGLEFYSGRRTYGLIRPVVGGYRPRDIQVVTAFDVAVGKVGQPLSKAILALPNNTVTFSKTNPHGPRVLRGPTLDGLSDRLRTRVKESPTKPASVAAVLRREKVDVLASYLPVGSDKASRHYVKACLDAGVSFINCMPSFLVSDPEWGQRFAQARVPAIGDDVKSQLGATVLHRTVLELFKRRGIAIDRTLQVNYGGNADFLNMLDQDRLTTKKVSKRSALTSVVGTTVPPERIDAGPVGFVPWLEDRKICDIRVEGRGFGGTPVRLDAKLEVWDSPNSAGVVIDAVRCAKLAMDRGEFGPLEWPSACFMKHPPRQHAEEEADLGLAQWIREGPSR
jgi:myo-inositol-1-phosphate synthase